MKIIVDALEPFDLHPATCLLTNKSWDTAFRTFLHSVTEMPENTFSCYWPAAMGLMDYIVFHSTTEAEKQQQEGQEDEIDAADTQEQVDDAMVDLAGLHHVTFEL